jgi:DNA-binding NarL/FixJ family response regulator
VYLRAHGLLEKLGSRQLPGLDLLVEVVWEIHLHTWHTPKYTHTAAVEILSLIARGLTNPEIAARLFLSSHTIKTHINRIFAKTGSRDRAAAIGYAHRHHLG